MSGHSKWSKIKHQKVVTDARKGKVFSRFAKEITVSARSGSNPDDNPGLRAVIEKARGANMPKENIERAIEKGSNKAGVKLAAVVYEAFGPEGLGIIIKILTDNKNRILSEIKIILNKYNGSIGAPNSVAWMFDGGKPKYPAQISNKAKEQGQKLILELEENEDVEEVWSGLD